MKRFVVPLLLILASLPLIAPFIFSGYFPTHDGPSAIIRLVEMNREIKDLQVPPRWAGFLNHGYGYPLFHFTYPFPFYLGEVLHVIGFGFVDAIKAIFILSIIGSAVTMYIFSGSAVATLFYLYAPYRVVNLFVRGSIGESLAFVWYPLLFWLGSKMVKERTARLIGLFAAVFGMLIVTHNASALLFAPVLMLYLYGIVFSEKKKTVHSFAIPIIGTILGFGVAAFFWLPALIEQGYTVLGTGALQKFDRFVYLDELLTGFRGIRDFPLTIGLFHAAALIFAFGIIGKDKQWKQFFGGAVTLVILLLLITPFAEFFWNTAPVYSSIDFAWRLLGVFSFVAALVIGYGAKQKVSYQIVCIVLCVGAVVQGVQLFPNVRTYFPDAYYETNDGTATAFDELMPIWAVTKPATVWQEKVVGASGSGSIVIKKNHSQQLEFDATMQTGGKLEINTLFFPGWKAYIDGTETPTTIHPSRGTIEVIVPQGMHTVKFYFTNTPIRTVGNTITLISSGIIGFLIIKKSRYEITRK